MAARYKLAALGAIDDLRAFDTGWTASFLVLFCAAFVAVYLPQTAFVSRVIKQQRVMLVLLPPQIVDTVDDLTTAIRDELAREGAGKGV